MIKMDFKGPSEKELTRLISAAAEKQISEKAQRAARSYGGVKIRFKHKSDGTLASVEFEGSEDAITAARAAVGG